MGHVHAQRGGEQSTWPVRMLVLTLVNVKARPEHFNQSYRKQLSSIDVMENCLRCEETDYREQSQKHRKTFIERIGIVRFPSLLILPSMSPN